MPWSTSVVSTTQNAEKTMRSRWGKPGDPAGRASAAARVTMPRIPHHEARIPLPTVGGCLPGIGEPASLGCDGDVLTTGNVTELGLDAGSGRIGKALRGIDQLDVLVERHL